MLLAFPVTQLFFLSVHESKTKQGETLVQLNEPVAALRIGTDDASCTRARLKLNNHPANTCVRSCESLQTAPMNTQSCINTDYFAAALPHRNAMFGAESNTGKFVLSLLSEYKGRPTAVECDGMADFLTQGTLPSPNTLLVGVSQSKDGATQSLAPKATTNTTKVAYFGAARELFFFTPLEAGFNSLQLCLKHTSIGHRSIQ